MATLYFKSLDKSDKPKIPFSVGETVIGRGPLLEIADKRVSRSHAVINVGKNGCSVTPKSSNPFFFTETDDGEKIILPKDEKKELKNGNSVGLLPDIFWFKIVISDSVNGTSKEYCEDASCEYSILSLLKFQPLPQHTVDGDKDEDSVEEITEEEAREKKIKKNAPKATPVRKANVGKAKAPTVTPPGKKEMALPLDKKRKLPDWMYHSANVAPPVKKKSPAKKVQPVASRQKATPSKPAKKVVSEDEYSPEEEVVKPASKSRRRKVKPAEDEEEEEDTFPLTKTRRRGRAAAADEDEEENAGTSSRGRRPSRQHRTVSYEDIDIYDSDDEFVPSLKPDSDSDFVAEFDNDSGSDWGKSSKKKGLKGKSPSRGKKSPASKKRASPRARRSAGSMSNSQESLPSRHSQRRAATKTKTYCDDYDEDEDDDDDIEEVIPEPKTRTPGRRGRPGKKDEQKFDEEDIDDGSESEKTSKKVTTGKKNKTGSDDEDVLDTGSTLSEKAKNAAKDDSEDDSIVKNSHKKTDVRKKTKVDSEEEDDIKVKKTKDRKKRRKPCQFGKNCYRKNPAHFKECCHPGDSSYEEAENSDEDDDDDKPECEFGTECYRTGEDHKKKFSHTKNPKKAKLREKDKRSVLRKDEDDDDAPNTYDYNDSFLDDGDASGESSSSYGVDDDDDYEPSQQATQDEDIDELTKDAKGFIKNKKMHKPATAK